MSEYNSMFRMVLIETLWNVKNNVGSSGSASLTVLIETLWNVKYFDPVPVLK